MQIVSLGVFNEQGDRRDVDFRLGALNIVTGKSKTGKSAVLDIVEYCLGRDTVTIPTGVISGRASWYYVIVQIAGERVLICRPNPEGASTNRAMVRTGDLNLAKPSFHELEVNADTEVVKNVLSERIGIESFTVDRQGNSLGQSFEISIRHALFYCFQNQSEIANRDALFHRQADKHVKTIIRDTLPYFLGAATPEQGALRRQILATRRALQRTQNEIRAAEADLDQQDARVSNLIESAVSLNVLPSDTESGNVGRVRSLLERILDYRINDSDTAEVENSRRRRELADTGRTIRSQIREIDDRLSLLDSLVSEQGESNTESRFQIERLRALDLLVPKGGLNEGDVQVCPLCDQSMEHPDESIVELQSLLNALEARLSVSKEVSSRHDATIDRLVASREQLVKALRENVVEIDALAQQESAIAAGYERRERVAFLQGRVSQELERGIDITSNLAELHNSERRYREQLARLEDASERDDPAAALRDAIDSVSELMTDFARHLELEGSDFVVRLDPIELTVVVQQPGGRVPLSRMGSAENWVGYHLVVHLALHHWFATHSRPVPRFLMFDQPTQAFFPEEIVDAAENKSADWEAVRKQFTLMRDVVDVLSGDLQIIVCDHANLADEWFQDAVVANWRNGIALIPSEWFH